MHFHNIFGGETNIYVGSWGFIHWEGGKRYLGSGADHVTVSQLRSANTDKRGSFRRKKEEVLDRRMSGLLREEGET